MKKNDYEKIRKNNDFLYHYFREQSGSNVPKQFFDTAFQLWLSAVIRIDPNTGIRKIFKFLDQKFGYTKENS